jgi:hypothetical protein
VAKLKTGELYHDDQITMARTASGTITLYFRGRPPVTVWPAITDNLDDPSGTAVCINFDVARENL